MRILSKIRNRYHPLHHLRKVRLFQYAVERWDPILSKRLSDLKHPINVRLFAHASLLASAEAIEPGIRKTFSACAGSSGVEGFWDVGANIGLFTFAYATINCSAHIISFEPDRRNLECLRRTADRWRLPQHKIIPCAVGEKVGRSMFVVDRLSGATGGLSESGLAFNKRHYGKAGDVAEVGRCFFGQRP